MTIPIVFVKVKIAGILRLKDLDKPFNQARRPYALGMIAGRRFGRSRPIPPEADSFDLTLETVAWEHEVSATGAPIEVSVQLWDELGDLAPQPLGSVAVSIPAPYLSQSVVLGDVLGLQCEIDSRAVPPRNPTAVLPRSAQGTTTKATLQVQDTVAVEITAIDGLHAPVNAGSSGIERSKIVPGYVSEDDLGRAYLNTDLNGKWKKDAQQLRLTARVTAIRGALPAGAQVKWTLIDVDDPTNDDPGVHVQWGRYFDAGDYDAAGDHQGARGGDNEGKPDRSPRWEPEAGFPLSIVSDEETRTDITGQESKVIFHCPNTAGDNFVLRADVVALGAFESFAATTGIITMWHLVHVAYFKMKSAFPLPIADIPPLFERACVELDFVTQPELDDAPFMAPNQAALDLIVSIFIDMTFNNQQKPGWFCLVAALESYPAPPAGSDVTIFDGPLMLQPSRPEPIQGINYGVEHIDIPISQMKRTEKAEVIRIIVGKEEVQFSLFASAPMQGPEPGFRHFIVPVDLQPEFVAADGSIEDAYRIRYLYSPRFTIKMQNDKPGPGVAGGYGASTEVHAKVMALNAPVIDGVSPSVTGSGPNGPRDYFAGRTIVFTHHKSYLKPGSASPAPIDNFNMAIAEVIAHELGHAFGMPHKCGYYDWKTPRKTTCCMNYTRHWMADEDHRLIPGTKEITNPEFCGRHLKEIRRVHLEDNLGLDWK